MQKPKVITLEKAADGSYVVPNNPIVEEVEDVKEEPILEKTVAGFENYQKRRKISRKSNKNKNVHEFIVNNGTKASDFLDGMQKTIKIFNLAKKLIK